MFLVSNVRMVKAAIASGIAGAIPALNYRTNEELREAIIELNATQKAYGINLIVNRSNYKLKKQLDTCCELGVPFIITSLGSPKQVIEKCRKHGIKVFCDVTNLEFAEKVASLKPDGLIAVLKNAGGHCGTLAAEYFIPALRQKFPDLPVISAGGVGDQSGIEKMLALGASGVSIGSLFIASYESDVSLDYKNACVQYGAKDIVLTAKLSGVPCTVINTPYVQKIGTNQNWLEKFLNSNRRIKKWYKLLVYRRGMHQLEKSAFSATYKNVWCAGETIEFVKCIRSVKDIVNDLVKQKA